MASSPGFPAVSRVLGGACNSRVAVTSSAASVHVAIGGGNALNILVAAGEVGGLALGHLDRDRRAAGEGQGGHSLGGGLSAMRTEERTICACDKMGIALAGNRPPSPWAHVVACVLDVQVFGCMMGEGRECGEASEERGLRRLEAPTHACIHHIARVPLHRPLAPPTHLRPCRGPKTGCCRQKRSTTVSRSRQSSRPCRAPGVRVGWQVESLRGGAERVARLACHPNQQVDATHMSLDPALQLRSTLP